MEQDFQPFNWHRLVLGLQPHLYMLEIALKCVLVYALLLVVMRLIGKRGQGNLSPMQQMLLIALGSAAGDALLYPTVPLAFAALILIGITGLTVGLDTLAKHSRRVRDYLESRPRVLVAKGVVDHSALDKERTTRRELYAALRSNGARSLSQVDYAILEVSGNISVFLNKEDGGDDDLLRYIVDDDHAEAPQSSR